MSKCSEIRVSSVCWGHNPIFEARETDISWAHEYTISRESQQNMHFERS